MSISIEKVAELLTLKKEEMIEEGLKALLEKKLRELRAETISICLKYKVSSLKELDEKINRGELGETDTFEDFTRLDFLEREEQKIKENCFREVDKIMKQELRTFYDEENDILYLAKEGEEKEFVEIQPGLSLEFDKNQQIIGIEIMQASRLLKEVIIPLQTKVKA